MLLPDERNTCYHITVGGYNGIDCNHYSSRVGEHILFLRAPGHNLPCTHQSKSSGETYVARISKNAPSMGSFDGTRRSINFEDLDM